MWGIKKHDNIYQVDNSPFDLYGISLGDTIMVRSENNILVFNQLIERSGHSTYRVRFCGEMSDEIFSDFWSKIERFGCTYEGTGKPENLFAIDIPDIEKVEEVYRIFEHFEEKGVLEFEEAHYSGSDNQ